MSSRRAARPGRAAASTRGPTVCAGSSTMTCSPAVSPVIRRAEHVHERGAAPRVLQPHPAQVPVRSPFSRSIGHRLLDRAAGAVGQAVAGPGDGGEKVGAATSQPTPTSGDSDLDRRAEQDHPLRVEAVEGGQRGDVVAELGVVVVLHDDARRYGAPRRAGVPCAGWAGARRGGTGAPAWCRGRAGRRGARPRSTPSSSTGQARPRRPWPRRRFGDAIAGVLDARPVAGPQHRGGDEVEPVAGAPVTMMFSGPTGTPWPCGGGRPGPRGAAAGRTGRGRRPGQVGRPAPGPAPGRPVVVADPRAARDAGRSWSRRAGDGRSRRARGTRGRRWARNGAGTRSGPASVGNGAGNRSGRLVGCETGPSPTRHRPGASPCARPYPEPAMQTGHGPPSRPRRCRNRGGPPASPRRRAAGRPR